MGEVVRTKHSGLLGGGGSTMKSRHKPGVQIILTVRLQASVIVNPHCRVDWLWDHLGDLSLGMQVRFN